MAEGEFWLDETEFLSQFDDVTVGYPISEEGHLKSVYTGNSLISLKRILNFQSLIVPFLAPSFNPDNSLLQQEIC